MTPRVTLHTIPSYLKLALTHNIGLYLKETPLFSWLIQTYFFTNLSLNISLIVTGKVVYVSKNEIKYMELL